VLIYKVINWYTLSPGDCNVPPSVFGMVVYWMMFDFFIVPVTEVERLWSRFQQLGPNSEGTLPNEAFKHLSFTSDPFVKQIWRTFPRDENGNVSFHSFVGVLMWWKTAPLEEKLEGIFKLLNRSQPLDVPALRQIIMKLDSSVDEETAESKAELLVKTLDDKEQGD